MHIIYNLLSFVRVAHFVWLFVLFFQIFFVIDLIKPFKVFLSYVACDFTLIELGLFVPLIFGCINALYLALFVSVGDN